MQVDAKESERRRQRNARQTETVATDWRKIGFKEAHCKSLCIEMLQGLTERDSSKNKDDTTRASAEVANLTKSRNALTDISNVTENRAAVCEEVVFDSTKHPGWSTSKKYMSGYADGEKACSDDSNGSDKRSCDNEAGATDIHNDRPQQSNSIEHEQSIQNDHSFGMRTPDKSGMQDECHSGGIRDGFLCQKFTFEHTGADPAGLKTPSFQKLHEDDYSSQTENRPGVDSRVEDGSRCSHSSSPEKIQPEEMPDFSSSFSLGIGCYVPVNISEVFNTTKVDSPKEWTSSTRHDIVNSKLSNL